MKLSKHVLILTSALILFNTACKKDKAPDETDEVQDYDRKAMLTNLANNYIVPAFSDYASKTSSLATKVNTFTSSPSEANLSALRTEWKSTLLAWQNIAFLEFGPSADVSLRAQTNIYPADTTSIKDNIAAGTWNLESASNFNAKGLQTLDFLISGIKAADADIVAYYTSNTSAKQYLKDVVNELKTLATSVSSEWSNSYHQTFINNSSSNSDGSSVSESINALSLHYEAYTRKGKIGLPVGVFNGISQEPMPGHVEALYYQASIPFALESVNAIGNFINGINFNTGENGQGYDDYLNFVNAKYNDEKLSLAINNQVEMIKTATSSTNDPFSNEVVNNNSSAKQLYDKYQALVPLIKVDMTSALGVLVTYQDNDGD